MWAKISTPATAMACAACIATAATLPTMGTAAEKLAETVSVKLSALSDIDAFSALGATSLTDIDAFSALGAPFIGTDAFSAVPNIVSFATTGDLSRASGLSGIDAFSALPVYLSGDVGALAPDANGVGGIAAFSAIPALLNIAPTNPAPDIPSPMMAQATLAQGSGSTSNTPTTGLNSLGAVPAAISALVPKPNAAPAPQATPQVEEEITPTATVADNSGADSQNITRNSKKFTPETIGDSPLLFGSSNPGGEGMRGYGSFLKKIGISGGEESSSATG